MCAVCSTVYRAEFLWKEGKLFRCGFMASLTLLPSPTPKVSPNWNFVRIHSIHTLVSLSLPPVPLSGCPTL